MAPPKKVAKDTPAAAPSTVRVRALSRGYWNHQLWEEGVVFDYPLPEDAPLPTWLERVRGRRPGLQADETNADVEPGRSDDVI